MSTRSYVGIIKNGKVTYGYHHSDSHLESLGIDLFKNIKTEADANEKINEYIVREEDELYTDSIEDFFKTPAEDIFIEFCYGFDVEENEWYVSSNHFTDASKIFKLTEVVEDDDEMEVYLDMYYPEYIKEIYDTIRKGLSGLEKKEFTYEFSTSVSVEAFDEDEAIKKAYAEFEDAVSEHGAQLFYMYDEYGKEV